MNSEELLAFAIEAVKNMKTEKDFNDFSRVLKKVTVEAALGAELVITLITTKTGLAKAPTVATAIISLTVCCQ